MHELSAALEVVKMVERFAGENGIREVDTLVLELGELSSYIPSYIEAVFPAAAGGTLLEDTKLRIETVTATGRCRDCGAVFPAVENKNTCPRCAGKRMELLGGKEFFIKEIVVRQGAGA